MIADEVRRRHRKYLLAHEKDYLRDPAPQSSLETVRWRGGGVDVGLLTARSHPQPLPSYIVNTIDCNDLAEVAPLWRNGATWNGDGCPRKYFQMCQYQGME